MPNETKQESKTETLILLEREIERFPPEGEIHVRAEYLPEPYRSAPETKRQRDELLALVEEMVGMVNERQVVPQGSKSRFGKWCYCIGRVMVAGRVVVAHADFCDAAKDVENEAEGRDA